MKPFTVILMSVVLSSTSAVAGIQYYLGKMSVTPSTAPGTILDISCIEQNTSENWDMNCTSYYNPQTIFTNMTVNLKWQTETDGRLTLAGKNPPYNESWELSTKLVKKGVTIQEVNPQANLKFEVVKKEESGRVLEYQQTLPTGVNIKIEINLKKKSNIEYFIFSKNRIKSR